MQRLAQERRIKRSALYRKRFKITFRRFHAPCGACRQILWEFCGDIWVHVASPGRGGRAGKATSYRMSDLLPVPFDGRNL